MPAAAVIRRLQALSGFTGCKVCMTDRGIVGREVGLSPATSATLCCCDACCLAKSVSFLIGLLSVYVLIYISEKMSMQYQRSVLFAKQRNIN